MRRRDGGLYSKNGKTQPRPPPLINHQQLSQLVAENLLSFDQKFWIRVAARADTADKVRERREGEVEGGVEERAAFIRFSGAEDNNKTHPFFLSFFFLLPRLEKSASPLSPAP